MSARRMKDDTTQSAAGFVRWTTRIPHLPLVDVCRCWTTVLAHQSHGAASGFNQGATRGEHVPERSQKQPNRRKKEVREMRGQDAAGGKQVKTHSQRFQPLLSHTRWFSLRSLAGLEQYLASVSVLRAADGSEANICPSKRVKRY